MSAHGDFGVRQVFMGIAVTNSLAPDRRSLLAPRLDVSHEAEPVFPATRYQGSKRRLLSWLWQQVGDLPFDRVLDVFGGTGAVSFLFKRCGKQVTYNDRLKFNHWIGTALIANRRWRLDDEVVAQLLTRQRGRHYDDFIERTFGDIYFTDQEDRWLDVVVQNIARLPGRYPRALAYYALFQSCLAKRPYNLFHRKNLYVRTAKVQRGFGNKTTWDRSFPEHFHCHLAQAHRAVFDSGVSCRAVCHDALAVPGGYDLVYIDPPYVSSRRVGVDYLAFYHFLEGLTDYANWPKRIDYRSKHLRLRPEANPWTTASSNVEAFRVLFRRYARAILVVSYRSDGCPGPDELADLLGEVKADVQVVATDRYQYALSTNRRSREVLLIGR